MDRYIVISSDCHAGLPGSATRDYLDPQYRETFDHAYPLQVEKIKAAEKAFLIQGDQTTSGGGHRAAGSPGPGTRRAHPHARPATASPGGHFPATGITEMNTRRSAPA